eukprot:TRINITY_DN8061_c1_g1_i1.p2 TRINITY_DN8061_c1_g1~~TRINITY_DN8061_c1_g1_i1.p2  ORF type:complete len:263 (+),score=22.16 TRINITY_DN8061_c1_g1_i1:52-840(+)
MVDCYSVLGLSRGASEQDIKKAFKKLALLYHPDRLTTSSQLEQKAAAKKFQEITEAYNNLSNGNSRTNQQPSHQDKPASEQERVVRQGTSNYYNYQRPYRQQQTKQTRGTYQAYYQQTTYTQQQYKYWEQKQQQQYKSQKFQHWDDASFAYSADAGARQSKDFSFKGFVRKLSTKDNVSSFVAITLVVTLVVNIYASGYLNVLLARYEKNVEERREMEKLMFKQLRKMEYQRYQQDRRQQSKNQFPPQSRDYKAVVLHQYQK